MKFSVDPSNFKHPDLWYPMGAGGMWLNYLIWCSQCDCIVPGNHSHFEFPYIESIEPRYLSYVNFYFHDSDHSNANIVLGSDHAWLNFFLNINAKKDVPKSFDNLVSTAQNMLLLYQKQIKFNLDWCLIFSDPEQFVQQLNKLVEYEIEYNSTVEQAIEQYRHSCAQITDYTDLHIRAWRTAIMDMFTDKTQSLPQRLQITEEIFYNTYYKI